MYPAGTSAVEKVYDQIALTASGCFEFTGWKDRHGYGRVYDTAPNRGKSPHRVVVEHEYGIALPPAIEVHHTCHNPACVNLDHLELLSVHEHNRLHGRQNYGRSNPAAKDFCVNGHPLHTEGRDVAHRSTDRKPYCRACGRIRRAEQSVREGRNLTPKSIALLRKHGRPIGGQ